MKSQQTKQSSTASGVFKPALAKAASASAITGLAGKGPGSWDSTTFTLFFAHCCNLRMDLRA